MFRHVQVPSETKGIRALGTRVPVKLPDLGARNAAQVLCKNNTMNHLSSPTY